MTHRAAVAERHDMVEDLVAQMRAHGDRATPVRRLLLQALADRPGHLTVESLGHLVCENCGTEIEVPGQMFASLTEQARDQYGFTIEPQRSAVVGLRARCRAGPLLAPHVWC